jgi:hypothetical protein
VVDMDIQNLQKRSDAYRIRFVGCLLAGFAVFAVLWWAGENGHKTAASIGVVMFVAIWIYGVVTWVLMARVRLQLWKARGRGA